MPRRSRSFRMKRAILPVVVGCFGEAGHCLLFVLLCNLALRFTYEVDDPLVGFQVFVPRRGCLPAGRNSHTYKCKERDKEPATLLDDKPVAGKFTELEMELKIILEQGFAISLVCRASHAIHRRLYLREVGARLYCLASRQSLHCSAEFIQLCNILLGQMDDSRTSP